MLNPIAFKWRPNLSGNAKQVDILVGMEYIINSETIWFAYEVN